MNQLNYEKPSLKFVSLRNEDAVANTCWGGHGNPNMAWYYDTEGEGYVSFQIGAGSCALNLINVKYYTDKEDSGVFIDKEDARYKEMQDALIKSGGNQGTSFKGEDCDFPVKPDPSWS